MADFADKLAALMTQRGETQSSLSRASGVSQTLISAYARRQSHPSWPNVQKLAKALGVKCHELEDDGIEMPAVTTPKKRGRPKKAT